MDRTRRTGCWPVVSHATSGKITKPWNNVKPVTSTENCKSWVRKSWLNSSLMLRRSEKSKIMAKMPMGSSRIIQLKTVMMIWFRSRTMLKTELSGFKVMTIARPSKIALVTMPIMLRLTSAWKGFAKAITRICFKMAIRESLPGSIMRDSENTRLLSRAGG